MNTAQPIRSEQELKDFMNFYEQVQYHPRNQLLLTMGLNTALRISDLLSLQWKQVYDLENRSVREHLLLVEAIYGIFNRFSLYHYEIDAAKCTKCGLCAKKCDMGVKVYENPNSAECIRCGKCKDVCPTGAIHSGIRPKTGV